MTTETDDLYSDFPLHRGCPVYAALAIATPTQTVVLACPFCGRQHYHGVVDWSDDYPTYRYAPCDPWEVDHRYRDFAHRSYQLLLVDGDLQMVDKILCAPEIRRLRKLMDRHEPQARREWEQWLREKYSTCK